MIFSTYNFPSIGQGVVVGSDANQVQPLSVCYTLSEAWSGVDWADLMAAQDAVGTDVYDR